MKKKIIRELRDLTDKAYRNQLDRELSILEEGFKDWKNKKIDCFELSDRIHQFHDGSARDLWKRYTYSKDYAYSVAIAIVEGSLQKSDISEEAYNQLKHIIERHFQDTSD